MVSEHRFAAWSLFSFILMTNTDSNSSGLLNDRSAIDDQLSPYYLHHSDNPGLVLVSKDLIGDNYASWSRAMLIALSAKNKLGFINGSIPRPPDADSTMLNSWNRNNNVVISWILNSVSKSASVIFSDSAADIWQDLKDRFQQSNGPRILQLWRELINLLQNQNTVGIYFTKLKTLWEELSKFRLTCTCGKCTCGGVKELKSYFQMEYIMTFLMGLNENFSSIRSQILLLDPLPPINKVFSLISQEEQQRNITSHLSVASAMDPVNNMAFLAKNNEYKCNRRKWT